MPDFRVAPTTSPVDGIDRVGAAYDRGLGGATGSDFAALGQGLLEGIDFGTKLDARLKQTARDNDPKTIANEQLRQDLANQATQELLNKSRLAYERDKKYGDLKEVIGIEGDILSNESQRIKNTLEETYGPEERETLIEQRLRAGLRGSGGKPVSDLDQLDKESEIFGRLKGKKEDEKASNSFEGEFDYQKAPTAQSPALSTEDQIRENLLNKLATVAKGEQDSQIADFSTQLSQRQAASKANEFKQRLEQSRNQSRLYSLENFQKLTQKATEAITVPRIYEDDDAGLTSTLSATNEMVADIRKTQDPEEKAIKLQALNGISEVIDLNKMRAEAAEFYKGDELVAANKSIDAWAAATGNLEQMNPVAQAAYKLGLDPKYVEDPEKTMQLLDSAITGGWVGVSENDFKAVTRGNPAIAAAQQAAERTPWFTTKTVFSVQQPTGQSDLSQDAPAIGTVKFYDSKGQDMDIEVQLNTARNLVGLDLVEAWSRQKQLAAPQEQATRETISGIRGTQEQINTAPRNRPQQAAVGAGPAATPQPTATPEPQSTATPGEEPSYFEVDIPGVGKYGNAKAYGLKVPLERPISSEERVQRMEASGKTALAERIRTQQRNMKPLEDKLDQEQATLDGKRSLVDRVGILIRGLESSGNDDLLSKRGKLKEFIANYQELSSVFGTDKAREIMADRGLITQTESAIIRDFFDKDGRTTAANTSVEQLRFIAEVMGENSDIQNLKTWYDYQTAKIKRETDIKDFSARLAADPLNNSKESIEKFINEYKDSEHSKPIIPNPAKYIEKGGRTSLIPGAQNLPDFVKNDIEVNPDGYYQKPLTYLKTQSQVKDNLKRERQQTSSASATEKKSLLASAGEAIGDFLVPEAQAEEFEPLEGQEVSGAEGFGEVTAVAANDTPEQDLEDSTLPDLSEDPELIAAQAAEEDTGEVPNLAATEEPAKTYAEQSGIEFKSPEAEIRFNNTVSEIKGDWERMTVAGITVPAWRDINNFLFSYLPDAATNYQGEELTVAIGDALLSAGLLPEGTTKESIRELAAAHEVSRRTMGEDSLPGQAALRATDMAGAGVWATLLGTGIGAGAGLVAKGAQAIPKVASVVSKAKGLLNPKIAKTLGYAPGIATQTAGDAAQYAMSQDEPGSSFFDRQTLDDAKTGAAYSLISRAALALPMKMLSPAAKNLFGDNKPTKRVYETDSATGEIIPQPGGRFSDKSIEVPNVEYASKILARYLKEAGISRTQLEKAMTKSAETGLPITSYLPVKADAMFKKLAADPEIAAIIEAQAKTRSVQTNRLTKKAIKDAGLNKVPTVDELQKDMQRSVNQLVADKQFLAERLADTDRAAALSSATDQLSQDSTKVINELTEGAYKNVDKVLNDVNAAVGTNLKNIELVLGTSQNPVDNAELTAITLDNLSKSLKTNLNKAYKAVDVETVPTDLFEGFVNKLQTDVTNFPKGAEVIEDVAQSFKQGGPLKTTGLSDDAQSLIEMRSKLIKGMYLKEMNILPPQAKKIIAEIDNTLKETYKRVQGDAFSEKKFEEFIRAQSEGRALADNLLEQRKVVQDIQAVLDDPNPSPGLYKKFFGSSAKLDRMRGIFGEDAAKEWVSKVKNIDDIIRTTKDIKAPGSFKPQELESIVKEAEKLGNSDFFFDKLINQKGSLSDEVAQALGGKDRTDFSDAALRWFKNKMNDTASNIRADVKSTGASSAKNTTQGLLGIKPDQLNRMKKFLAPKQRAVFDKFVSDYKAIQRAGRITESVGTASPTSYTKEQGYFRRLWPDKFIYLAQLLTAKVSNNLSRRDLQIVANSLLDPDPKVAAQLYAETAKKMKPPIKKGQLPTNKVYSDFSDYEDMVAISRKLASGIGTIAGNQDAYDKRRLERIRENLSGQPTIQEGMTSDFGDESGYDSELVKRLTEAGKTSPPSLEDEVDEDLVKRLTERKKKKLTQADFDVIQ